ncbi:hypothetical protein HK405_011580, partial [Cladochytrium tenue]
WAATYALHRFCSHLSIHRLLPPAHQAYWSELEAQRRAAGPEAQAYEYAADPFAAAEQRARAGRERERAEQEARERAERAARPWEGLPPVRMSGQARARVEELVRGLAAAESKGVAAVRRAEGGSGGAAGGSDGLDEEDGQVVEALVAKGFRRAHAVEAVGYCDGFVAALDWLCIHVPEDDLPAAFHASTNEITTAKGSPEELAREWAIRRVTDSGFSRKLLVSAYDACGGSIVRALADLVANFASDSLAGSEAQEDGGALWESWLEEVEAVRSVLGDDAVAEEPDPDVKAPGRGSDEEHLGPAVISVLVRMDSSPLHLVIGVPRRPTVTYPYQLPALYIRSEGLPAYMKLGIVRAVAQEAAALLGSPMVLGLVGWLQDNLDRLLESPPPLAGLVAPAAVDSASPAAAASADSAKLAKRRERRRQAGPSDPTGTGARLKELHERSLKSQEYQRMLRARQKLPSYKYREAIIESVTSRQAVIVCGETGCGKSTQTGQFLLEHILETGKGGVCNIICTQPRRISALSLAERVAAERAEKVGETVGYAIRGDTVRGPDTRLLFCTTGILLRMLTGDPDLRGVSHVIVDEVHERSVDSDFLLVILRELIAKRPDFRVVLMSATIDSDTFSRYFDDAPVLSIPGFTHPVTDLYLEDVLQVTGYAKGGAPITSEEKLVADGGSSPYQNLSPRARSILERESPDRPVDFSLVAAVVRTICRTAKDDADSGAAGAVL